MQNNDVVAERQADGRYRIRRWRESDQTLFPIPGHDELYEEADMYLRLNQLRASGDTYVRDTPHSARLIQP